MKLAVCLLLLIGIASGQVQGSCETVRCKSDHTCKMMSVRSCSESDKNNCQTVKSPVCVPVTKHGICPVQELTETVESTCKIDSDCPLNLKCCPHQNNSYCFKPCMKMMCKCRADTSLVYVNNSLGCPICTCVSGNSDKTRGVDIDDCSLPKLKGLCRARFLRFYYNSETQSCERFIFGGCQGNGNNFFSKASCEKKCLPKQIRKSTIAEKCNQEPVKGMCKAYLERFFYNSTAQECQKFIYGGCQSNENNFESHEICTKHCNPETLNQGTELPSEYVCKLDSQPGPCFAYFERFFFNKNTSKCEKFVYGGCDGNANRFTNEVDCQSKCKPSALTVVDQDVCTLKQETGPCEAYFERYFYNETARECQQFVYGGCKGNANNFETKDQCDQKCPSKIGVETAAADTSVDVQSCTLNKESGPCLAYIESFFFNTETRSCEPFIYGGCQGNANRFSSKSECESACNREFVPNELFDKSNCKLEKDSGPCFAFFEMFTYNADMKRCEKFVYGGCGGNGNRFHNIEECESSCQASNGVIEMKDLCQLDKIEGPCRSHLERYYYNNTAEECQLFIYGGCQGNANNFETSEECHNSCVKTETIVDDEFNEESCYLPSDGGPCYAYISSFYYNADAGKCEPFVYGGCQGNGNRFNTIEQCEKSCAKVHKALSDKVDKCQLEADTGLCRGYFERFYYDKKTHSCKGFLYGGCKGNQNNFETLEECNDECNRSEPDVDSRDVVGTCRLPKKTGRCLAYFERFYFNTESNSCEMFVYGGCEANANNFENKEECEAKCPAN